ncbi:uncharacterized protein N7479_010298 [Penicillium vulpinum]|uniref:ABC transporter n=1 Tax=Penicillium vulpinum TaxID=29845 RepID=A0A1V6S8T0_9EURO|nr:uncharacterized protein N7479_010298 [Penicillium vulpinum]KAJ5951885.1 hypothetical protein N7479_010298 [Penicillium vulpinum]OQE10445.1 hypothetical protein PENVUL_c004G04855 [Penicillium vulpinum]
MDLSGCVDDVSFGPTVKGCRGNFDFTLKFEKIILSILPSALFIALSVPRGIYLARRPVTVRGATFRFTKLAATVIYAVLRLVLLIISSIEPSKLRDLSITADVLSFLTAISISVLSSLEHSRSPRPSILLSAFLSLTVLFDIAQVRSLWLLARSYNEFTYVKLFTAAIAWKAVLVLLQSLHHQGSLIWDRKTHSPEETTGLYGLASFFWLTPLFLSGYKKVLSLSDLFPLDKSVSVEALKASLYIKDTGFHGDTNGLTKALTRALAVPILLPVAPRIALVGLTLCQPLLIDAILNFLEEPNTYLTTNKGYGLIGATILVYTGMPIATALYWYLHERALFMTRALLVSAIYNKTIKAQISAADDSAAVTLMSVDVERIRMGLMQLHEFWANPVQVAIVCWLLQRQLGAAFVAPMVVVLICIVSSSILMHFIGPRQMAWMKGIQKRIGHTANVIGNMKHLKISGLTAPVEDSIQKLRLEELKAGGKFRAFLVGSVGIGFTPVLLGPVFAFALTSREVDVTTIFTSLSYLQLLSGPLSQLFQVVPQLLAAFSCLSRVQLFLEKEPRHDCRQIVRTDTSEKEHSSENLPSIVEIKDADFGWEKDTLTLKNINISMSQGLNMIIGPVASGKSTFCKALLGETPIARGEIFIRTKYHRVGYCDQVPFLPNESIMDTIIGFSTFDEKRYANVIEATLLAQDLPLLPKGDQTMIGSDGLALSGGQKQRISLARALYLQCDLLILDDALGGLDATTEEHIFNNVFGPSGILKQRETVVILCTNAIRHLPSADYIVALGTDGTVVEQGRFEDLVANHGYVHSLGFQADDNSISHPTTTPRIPQSDIEIQMESIQASTTESEVSIAETNGSKSSRNLGDFSVFAYYCRSIGAFWLTSFVLIGILCGFLSNFPAIWLSYWSTDSFNRSKSFYIGIYGLFQCLALATILSEAAIGMLLIIRNSGSRLHEKALRTVISAPLSFFSQTDTGTITNLFSQDMTFIDGELPQALINTSLQTWIAVGGAAVVATSSPYIVITYPFILSILYGVQRFYLRTSRQLRLLDLEAKSPLYTHFLDTIKGAATLRAFGWIENSVSVNNDHLDTSQRPAYQLSMIQRWLAFVLDMIVAIIALLVVTLITQLRPSTGFTGASLVSIMTLGKTLASLVQMYTLLETSIGAVSRLKSFSDKTVPEDLPGETNQPPTTWPLRGRIEVKNMSAAYGGAESTGNSDTLALRDLTFTIEAGQKVAICGRTGSGKSSIILLLLRLLDPLASCTGELTIDDVSLLTIDRSTLRRRIIAVPQDSTLFPDGTSFRKNLDPFDTANEEECQAVLEMAGLWSLVSDRGGLMTGLSADGLSHGQKQLFSLARAVLRRRVRAHCLDAEIGDAYIKSLPSATQVPGDTGIIILDEVNRGVDIETQNTMQDIIRCEFAGYTVVMVSHGLDMVMDFDKVLVMDEGKLVEEGSPMKLSKEVGSRFRDLWMVGKHEISTSK